MIYKKILHLSPGVAITLEYVTFLGPNIISFISPKNDPTLATIDPTGVPARSTALATVSLEFAPSEVNEASQNKKITAVIPNADQKAYRCLM